MSDKPYRSVRQPLKTEIFMLVWMSTESIHNVDWQFTNGFFALIDLGKTNAVKRNSFFWLYRAFFRGHKV